MKKMFILILTLAVVMANYKIAYATYVYDTNGNIVLSEDSYTEDGKIKVYSLWDRYMGDAKLFMELPKIDISIPKLTFIGADNKRVEGVVTYPNRGDIVPGIFDLQWLFTPNDNSYEVISGTLRFEVFPEDSDASKGIMPTLAPDEPTTPSLTASTVSLNTMTAYDINLDNKVSGSSYLWTSSDTGTVEVNPKSGLVKAKKEGKATVICEITLPDQTKQYLLSVVTVGYDDNAPLLTETSLDLETGDTFDINLENKVAKSKYRWVSSNKSVIKVNSANGKVTAVGAGEAYVTCTITTLDKQIIVLRCDISVIEAPAN